MATATADGREEPVPYSAAVFVTLGWGVGVVMNAWDVYVRKPITEDELEREIEHLEASQLGRKR